jgi:hypothetical protein
LKFALPLDNRNTFYRYNPCSAQKFAIYTTHGTSDEVTYAQLRIVDNPWQKVEGAMCDPEFRYGGCEKEVQKDLNHIVDHYAILEVLNGCNFLLGDNFCENTRRAMHNAKIKTYNIPPFISQIDKIIEHFLIGAKIADSVEHIHHAS